MNNVDKIVVRIFRYDPSKDKKPRYETYDVPFFEGMRVLDAILYVKSVARDLAFRWSCGSGRCGTCVVMVNGEPKLACWEPAENEMTIEPLPYFPLTRDLVVDRSEYDQRVIELRPFLERARPPEKFPEDIKHDQHVVTTDRLSDCIHCLACISACPILKKAPRWIGPSGLVRLATYAADPRDKGDKPRIAYTEGDIYDCTACGKCEEVCPKEIAVPELVIERVRALCIEEGRVPSTVADALEGVFKYGNPWGLPRSRRAEWARDLKVNFVSEDKETDLLYFVGCAASYDPRAQQAARALVKSLNTLGIEFSILGNQETCCGNEVASIGEKGLFEELVDKNLGIFDRYHISEIITSSPHCFHAFKNRYGGKLQVRHYTQYLADWIEKGKAPFSRKVEKVVTFQDPCFLGRHNAVYEEPRRILESIPGVKFVELNMSRKRSVCCEGGGGRMWYDLPGERLAEIRLKEALDVGAEVLAVACPFCLLTFDDAIKTTETEDAIQTMDIMELLVQAL